MSYQQPPPPYNPSHEGYQQGYLPQQQGYQYPPQLAAPAYPYQQTPQYTAATNVTVAQQRPAVVATTFGERPLTNFQCPYCGNVVTTQTRNKTGNATLIVMLIAFLFIGFFALIFLCIPIFDDVEHVCPVDGHVVGTYKRF